MKLGSLFDGIGGFPYSASKYGFEPVWASEIEPFPIKVTQCHFPDMKHLGDITQINGAAIEPVDVITFGSPCQDLSVAGKREGLAGERSGLFMEAVRIIREMRRATGGKYPRFAVWENVPGAFSSHGGQDFRAVLEEIGNAQIPMPKSGKWATAGMVRTETADIAWRTLDAQYWGVPQRRKRIFLVADFAGTSAGEVLFIESCLRGHPAESGEEGEEAARAVGNGFAAAGFKSEQNADARGIGWQIETAPTLPSEGATPCICSRINSTPEGISGAVSSKWAKGTGGPAGDEHYNLIVLADQGGSQMDVHDNISPTLRAQEHGHQPLVMREVSRTLRANAGAAKHESDWESLIIEPRSQDGVCRIHHDVVPTLNTAQGGQRQPCVCIQNATRGKSQNGLGVSQDDVAYTLDSLGNHAVCIQGSMIGRADKNGPQGDGINEEVSFTLNTTDRHAVATYWDGGQVSDCLDCSMLSKGQMMPDKRRFPAVMANYAVRRLTPTEYLRLQGYPDWWLDIEGATDTAKYKAIGNSVAIPCVDFVMSGIARVLRRAIT